VSDGERDEFVERAVRGFLDEAAKSSTVQDAERFVQVLRAELAARLSRLRRERADPKVVEAFAHLLGRLTDATECGGTRR